MSERVEVRTLVGSENDPLLRPRSDLGGSGLSSVLPISHPNGSDSHRAAGYLRRDLDAG